MLVAGQKEVLAQRSFAGGDVKPETNVSTSGVGICTCRKPEVQLRMLGLHEDLAKEQPLAAEQAHKHTASAWRVGCCFPGSPCLGRPSAAADRGGALSVHGLGASTVCRMIKPRRELCACYQTHNGGSHGTHWSAWTIQFAAVGCSGVFVRTRIPCPVSA